MQIKNSVFIVTGAGSGLGAATARMLADNGGKIVLADVNEDAGRKLAQDLGASAEYIKADVTREDDGTAVITRALDRFGSLHGLANCAGIAKGERISGKDGPHSLANFTRIITVNLIGTFNMLRLAATAMMKGQPNEAGERGVIVNTASVAAFDGQIGQSAYSASKGGVASLTLPAAREFARYGIRVMTIAPGIFETPMMMSVTPEIRDALAANVPFPQRFGRPSEYAQLVRHIIENEMLNGEVIRLDGALRMAPK